MGKRLKYLTALQGIFLLATLAFWGYMVHGYILSEGIAELFQDRFYTVYEWLILLVAVVVLLQKKTGRVIFKVGIVFLTALRTYDLLLSLSAGPARWNVYDYSCLSCLIIGLFTCGWTITEWIREEKAKI